VWAFLLLSVFDIQIDLSFKITQIGESKCQLLPKTAF